MARSELHMNNINKFFYLFLLILNFPIYSIASTNCNCPNNLLSNGNFEGSSTADWNLAGVVDTDYDAGYDGCGSVTLRINRGSGSGLVDPAMWQQENGIVGGKIYTLSFDAATDDPEGLHQMFLRFYNNSGTLLSQDYLEINHDIDSDDALKSYQFSLTAPSGAAYARIGVALNENKIYLDNICFANSSATSPTLVIQSPVLETGTLGSVGSTYRLYNVLEGTQAILTIVSKSHSDIVIRSMDERAFTNGGYDWAFQPIIDYNWYNSSGSNDPPGDKSVTFRFDFVDEETGMPVFLPQLNMTAVDIDGDGGNVREWVKASNFQAYEVQSPSELTLSSSLKALGDYRTFPGVVETALSTMISYIYNGGSSITVTYGGNYNGGSISDVSEARMNCLFFKYYNFNTSVACPAIAVSGGNAICAGNSITLNASNSGSTGNCTIQWGNSMDGINFSDISGATGTTYTTPNLGATTYYRARLVCAIATNCGVPFSNVEAVTVLTNCTEVCNNGIDDDNDGFTDEEDSECVNVVACMDTPGKNEIKGTVFNDADANAVFDDGEIVQSRITLQLYDDKNGDGNINGADQLISAAITGNNGKYTFDVNPSFSAQYDENISDDCHDAKDGNDGEDKLQFGKDKDVGLLFDNINIPAGSTIENAYLYFTAKGDKDKSGSVAIFGENVKNPADFCFDNDVTNRSQTTAAVNWTVGNWIKNRPYKSVNIKTIVQELVNNHGNYSDGEMAFLLISTGDENMEAKSHETGGAAEAPRLVINYTINTTEHFLIKIDESSLPGVTTLTTSSLLPASFNALGQTDCNNNFGFQGTFEICNNNVDDDNDGFIDEADADCFISPSCLAIPNQNNIIGTVFEDANANLIIDNGDQPQVGITLNLYEDNNNNGIVDGGDTPIQSTPTNAEGNYTFTVNPVFSADYTGSIINSCDDAKDGNDGEDKIQFGKDKDIGLRFRNINIPAGSIINSAHLYFTAKADKDKFGSVRIYAHDRANPTHFCSDDDVVGRSRTNNSTNWALGDWLEDQEYQSPDLSLVVQELVNSHGDYINGNMAFIMLSTGGENMEAKTYETNDDGTEVPRLVINYSPSVTANYLVAVDENTLPNFTSLTTTNIAAVNFSAQGLIDCDNNFGFDVNEEICDNNIDDDGDNLIDCEDPDCKNGLTATVLASPAAICLLGSSSISVSGTGGKSPYIFTWSNGLGNGVTKTVSPAVTTTYTITITDAIGCTETVQTTVSVAPCPEICGNGIDDDFDNLIDEADPDCCFDAPIFNNEIGDKVWLDIDADGELSNLEIGLANMEVILSNQVLLKVNGVIYTPGTYLLSTFTDANGVYHFNDVPDGNWQIKLNADTLIYTPIYDADGDTLTITYFTIENGVINSTTNSWCASSDCNLEVDFGLTLNGDHQLGGAVCIDTDADGICSTGGETLLGTIDILLYDGMGNYFGGISTDNNGSYLFPRLIDSNYTVLLNTHQASLNTYHFTTKLEDTPATSLLHLNNLIYQSVPVISDVFGLDFGFILNLTEICGDGVDNDNNGLTDCEEPICGVSFISLTLTNPDNCPDLNNGSIIVDALGDNLEYSKDNGTTYQSSNVFDNLESGTYPIRIRNNVTLCSQDSMGNILSDPNCPEVCDNGIDDDLDGYIDYEDPDCQTVTPIIATYPNTWICENRAYTFQAANAGGSNTYSWNFGTYAIPSTATGIGPHTVQFDAPTDTSAIYPQVIMTVHTDNYTVSDTVNLQVRPTLKITNTATTHPSTCNGNNGSIALTVTGMTGECIEISLDNGNSWAANNQTIFDGLSGGIYEISTRYCNGECEISQASIIIADPTPVIVVDDLYNKSCPGLEIEGNVFFNDQNLDNVTFSLLTNTINGTIDLAANGTFSYTPALYECITDQFSYLACNETTNCCAVGIARFVFRDTVAPKLLNVPADLTINCDEEVPTPSLVSAVDNCPSISIDVTEKSTQGEDGCSLHDYTLTRTWVATDVCGNTVSDKQIVDVKDITAPDIYRIYTLPNGKKLIAGVMENVSTRWKTVQLPIDFATTPLIFTQVSSTNETTPIVARIKHVSVNQFELKIQEEAGNDGVHEGEKVAWIALEAGLQNTDYLLEARLENIADGWNSLAFDQTYTSVPAIFTSMQTTNDQDAAYPRYKNLSTTEAEFKIAEEVSDGLDASHLTEKVAILALDTTDGYLRNDKGQLIGEVGQIALNDTWKMVSLKNKYYNPVVVASSLSQTNDEPAFIRVKNVTENTFELHVEEWDYLDGVHPSELVAYMVIEGTVPLDIPFFCDAGTDSLTLGKDMVAIDNCDVNVTIKYEEKDSIAGASFIKIRTWSSIDECGNETHYRQNLACDGVALSVRTMLQGAMTNNNGSGLMRDDLRKKGLIPLKEPYTALPNFKHIGTGGGETITENILNKTGEDAVVDWIMVELRPKVTPGIVLATQSVLVTRDGDVINTLGDSVLIFPNILPGDYYVSVKHRNHLDMMTLYTYSLGPNNTPLIDFTYEFMPIISRKSTIEVDGKRAQWSGDLNGDNKIIYQGPNNDIFYMFLHIVLNDENINYLTNYITRGYTTNDFNMDGVIIFQGPNNDRANLLWHTILSHEDNEEKLTNFVIQMDLPDQEEDTILLTDFPINAVTLTNGKDTYIKQTSINVGENYGKKNNLHHKRKNGDKERSLIQFDLSGYSGPPVTSAKLYMYLEKNEGGGNIIEAHKITTPWKEGEGIIDHEGKANWIHASPTNNWNTPGGDFSPQIEGTMLTDTLEYQEMILSPALVQYWIDHPEMNFGIMLFNTGGLENQTIEFSSFDGVPSQRPYLILNGH